MKYIAKILAFIGAFIAATATTGCYIVIFDEPNPPNSFL